MLVTGISNLKNIPFSIFSGGHIFKALIDKLDGLSILHTSS